MLRRHGGSVANDYHPSITAAWNLLVLELRRLREGEQAKASSQVRRFYFSSPGRIDTLRTLQTQRRSRQQSSTMMR